MCEICNSLRNIIETAQSQQDAKKVEVFTRLLATHERDVHGGAGEPEYPEVPGSEVLFGRTVRLGK